MSALRHKLRIQGYGPPPTEGEIPMKRISIALFALAICLALVVVPAATAKKKKKKSFVPAVSLNIAFTNPTPASGYNQATPGTGTFTGKVTSGGGSACVANRPVSITRSGGGITVNTLTVSDGTYRATVA